MYLSIIKATYDKTMVDIIYKSFPGGSDGKESASNVGDQSSIPELGKSPGERNGYPLQCSCLENSMDRGAWPAMGRKELDTTEHTHRQANTFVAAP